jgi:type IV fimbrial biogenesis protein FimT
MRGQASGFTLVELMITVALVAIVLTLGAPSMRELILNNRLATDYNNMLMSLTLARAEAIKRGARTRVCIRNATPDCDGTATHWEDGWLVIADTNGNDTMTAADGDLIMQNQGALTDGTTLRGNTKVTRSVAFNARGFSGSSGTLTLCDSRGARQARGIVISNTGRARRAIDSNGDGTVEDGSGNNLTCP